MKKLILQTTFAALLGFTLHVATATASESGFKSLFDGKTLKGWTYYGQKTDSYFAKDGLLISAKGARGNLLSDREYEDFVLRLEYRLDKGANNGVAIHAPLTDKSAAYEGIEIQILDDSDPKYKDLKPAQYCGSVYGVVAAKRGALKPVGEWNTEEITCIGRHYKVKLNGKVIVDTDLNKVTDPELLKLHPGMLRDRGHIGFLGHDDYVEFRNVRIKELPKVQLDNRPPEGFQALFNGRDLTGWQGMNGDLGKRAKMTPDQLAAGQAKADGLMHQNWVASKGVLTYVGDGYDNLCTKKPYGNFEMLVDWRIQPDGDSGVYLRGNPQVQIWDKPEGSGGLWNNKVNPSKPSMRADHFVTDWNRFRILMIGDKVVVYLNNELVVYGKRDGVALDNYWAPGQPLPAAEAIELQAHKNPVQFKNVFIRELP